MDKETQEVYKEGEKWENFVKSADWQDAKKKLYEKMFTFDSLSQVTGDKKTFEEIGREASVRQAVVGMLLEWIQELEGAASQHEGNKQSMETIRKEVIVQHYE